MGIKRWDLGKIMDVKDVFRTIVLEVSENELAEMVGSIKAILSWIASRSLSAKGTAVIDLEENLTKTYNELNANLRYMRE